MKTLKNFALLAIGTGMMLTSCTKEMTNPSTGSLGVKIQATNKSFSISKSASLTTPAFVWDSNFIFVSKIEFEAEKRESEMSADSSDIHLEWTGPKKVDLFRLNSLIGNITLQPGIYHEISLTINSFKTDAGASPNFYLSGTYTNSAGSGIPIALIVDEDFDFRVKQEGAKLDAVNDYTSLINLNLSLLWADIGSSDLDAATLTNGKIIISSSSNSSLYDKIVSNLSSCEETEISKGGGSNSDDGNGSGSGNGNGGTYYGNGSGSGSGNGNGSGSGSYDY